MTLPAADRLAILELLARGLRALDAGDGEAAAACFTADGVLDVPPHGRFEGREAIAAFVRAHEAAAEHGSQHWTNNVVLGGDEDGATLSCYLLGFDLGAGAGGGPAIAWLALVDAELRREGGEWRLASFRRSLLGSRPDEG
ncbi:MAG: nuclear transport factor 2 family protein [Chloroflexi bacterium]|nr:nuclear transport factor 2 family protein [Chloroflexota bacterium]